MSPSRKNVDNLVQYFLNACEQKKLRITHQRLEIFRELVASDAHPDVETIHNQVKKRIPMISLDTVYRNLKLLADEGIVSMVGLGQERIRFDGNIFPHHHFVCVKCGNIQDFVAESFNTLRFPEEVKSMGESQSIHVEVKGICKRCQSRSRPG